MKATLTIFGTPEQHQTVEVDFEYYSVRKFLNDDEATHFVNYAKVLSSLNFIPTDIDFDLALGIAESMGWEVNDVRIECEPVYVIVHTEKDYTTEPLFI